MKVDQPRCRRDEHSLSSTHEHGTDVYILGVSKYYPNLPNEYGGRGRFRPGDYDRKEFSSYEELWEFAWEHGYRCYFGRNTCKYVLSRAARRRGYTTDNIWYHLRKKHAEAPMPTDLMYTRAQREKFQNMIGN